MHLLAREEVGLRCLLRVAAHESVGPVTIGEIAQAETLTPEYAAKLMRRLRLGGLVRSTRGAAGGYRLARPGQDITVWDAVSVLDDAFLPGSFCDCAEVRDCDCTRTLECSVRTLWRHVGERVRESLEAVSLADLCAGERTGEALPLPVVTTSAPL